MAGRGEAYIVQRPQLFDDAIVAVVCPKCRTSAYVRLSLDKYAHCVQFRMSHHCVKCRGLYEYDLIESDELLAAESKRKNVRAKRRGNSWQQ